METEIWPNLFSMHVQALKEIPVSYYQCAVKSAISKRISAWFQSLMQGYPQSWWRLSPHKPVQDAERFISHLVRATR